MSPTPDFRTHNTPANELTCVDPDRILRDKFTDLARQIKLAMYAEVFIVPVVGEIAAQRDHIRILAACQTHGCVVNDQSDSNELVGHRIPARLDGRPQMSWEYIWDGAGRLTHLTGTPLSSEGKLNATGASKEYKFSYTEGGMLESAVIANYTLAYEERELMTRFRVNLRMDQKSRSEPRNLTLASFSDRAQEEHASGLIVEGGYFHNLTRLGFEELERPAHPAQRIAELSVTIPFIEKLLMNPPHFEPAQQEILQKELLRQMARARIELKDMYREQAKDRLNVVYALNDTFSSRVGDVFCDPDLSAHEKKKRISQIGEEVDRSLAAATDLSIKQECAIMLRAVRAASELLGG